MLTTIGRPDVARMAEASGSHNLPRTLVFGDIRLDQGHLQEDGQVLHRLGHLATRRATWFLFAASFTFPSLVGNTCQAQTQYIRSVSTSGPRISSGTTYNVYINWLALPPAGSYVIVTAEFDSNGVQCGQSLPATPGAPVPPSTVPPQLAVGMTAPTVATQQKAWIFAEVYDANGNYLSGFFTAVMFMPPP